MSYLNLDDDMYLVYDFKKDISTDLILTGKSIE